jgi:hypothetical protein
LGGGEYRVTTIHKYRGRQYAYFSAVEGWQVVVVPVRKAVQGTVFFFVDPIPAMLRASARSSGDPARFSNAAAYQVTPVATPDLPKDALSAVIDTDPAVVGSVPLAFLPSRRVRLTGIPLRPR